MSVLKSFCGAFSSLLSSNTRARLPSSLPSARLFSIDRTLMDEMSSSKQMTEGEVLLTKLLQEKFPRAKTVEVNDISGGCGNMYAIYVESIEFKNMKKVQQHKLINETLKTQIKNNMHGLRIMTAVPVDEQPSN